jgi:hypothetical protein
MGTVNSPAQKTEVKPNHRYLTFSLRTLFVVTTALAVWLGIVVNRAREQREAVKAIEAAGGSVYYNYNSEELMPRWRYHVVVERPGPAWLRRLIGDDYFQDVWQVDFGSPSGLTHLELSKAIPHLQRLRKLNRIRVFASTNVEYQGELKAALPKCDVRLFLVLRTPTPIKNLLTPMPMENLLY